MLLLIKVFFVFHRVRILAMAIMVFTGPRFIKRYIYIYICIFNNVVHDGRKYFVLERSHRYSNLMLYTVY